MNKKISERLNQALYGAIIGGLALIGLVVIVKEKVLDKIKKI